MSPLKRGALLVLGAIAAGGAGVWFGERHLEQRADALEASFRNEHAARRVIVADRDLARGETLEQADVALREMPATHVHASALARTGWSRIAGKRLRAGIAAGKPVLESHLRASPEARLAEQISRGDRAITIPVSGGGDIAALLTPGDRLDLMLTFRDGDGRQTVPLLDDIPILATGSRFQRSPQPEPAQSRGYDDLTLAVSPREAAQITHALAIGEIRVVLRAHADEATGAVYRIDADSLVANRQDTDASAAVQPVEIIIGGRQ